MAIVQFFGIQLALIVKRKIVPEAHTTVHRSERPRHDEEGMSVKSSWSKQHRYNGPDYWRYDSHEHVSFPAIAIVKRHERIIAKIWGPITLSDNELVMLVQEQYSNSPEMVVERIAGRGICAR